MKKIFDEAGIGSDVIVIQDIRSSSIPDVTIAVNDGDITFSANRLPELIEILQRAEESIVKWIKENQA